MRKRLFPYWQALLDILKYQIVTKAFIGILLWLLSELFTLILARTGRVALTSGDFKFMFTNWQGWFIPIIAILVLFIYTAFDLNTKIVLSRDLLEGRDTSVWHSMKQGFLSIRRFFCPRGIGVILYIALIAPLIGFGISIRLTENLYIPTFISSVITSTPLYLAAYIAVLIVFAVIGFRNIFLLHGVILDGLSVKEAGIRSKALMRKNRRNFAKQTFLYALVFGLFYFLTMVIFLAVPLAVVIAIPVDDGMHRYLTIAVMLAGSLISGAVGLFGTPLYLMKSTQLYYTYSSEETRLFPARRRRRHPFVFIGVILCGLLIAVVSVFLNMGFDQLFPAETEVGIVAHRAGGSEAPENTVSGLEAAYAAGAFGSEIDIQRTKDGHYVLNHDSTFERVAGVRKRPEEMTLDEVKELSVGGEPVPTFEEALDASRGRLILFTELKGNTADRRMADDAVRIVKEAGMEDEVVLISLKYDLIDYIETEYPEIQTGYLTWLTFGNTAALNCDYIGLEEESATAVTISAIHEQGKKALIWTPNEKEAQTRFLLSSADGIITDNISQAFDIADELSRRSDIQRITDNLLF